MSLKTIIGLFAACQIAISPTLAQAQSSDFDRNFTRQGAEARLSFTIPLGNGSDKTKTAPRLSLGVRNYTQPSTASTDWMRADPHPYKEMRLGFTLEDTPKLMMNEQVLVQQNGEQANIGTAGKIGLGVVAVVVAGAALIAIAFVSCYNGTDCDEE